MKPTALIVLALAIPSLAMAQTARPEFPQSLDGTRDWVSFGPLSIWSDYRLGPVSADAISGRLRRSTTANSAGLAKRQVNGSPGQKAKVTR